MPDDNRELKTLLSLLVEAVALNARATAMVATMTGPPKGAALAQAGELAQAIVDINADATRLTQQARRVL